MIFGCIEVLLNGIQKAEVPSSSRTVDVSLLTLSLVPLHYPLKVSPDRPLLTFWVRRVNTGLSSASDLFGIFVSDYFYPDRASGVAIGAFDVAGPTLCV